VVVNLRLLHHHQCPLHRRRFHRRHRQYLHPWHRPCHPCHQVVEEVLSAAPWVVLSEAL
jgi:hypothetical protein